MIYGMINPFIVIAVFPPSVFILSMSTEDKISKRSKVTYSEEPMTSGCEDKMSDGEKIRD